MTLRCITGLGWVSALGSKPSECFERLCDGVRPTPRARWADAASIPACDDPLTARITPRDRRVMGPQMLLGVHAAVTALEEAGAADDAQLMASIDHYCAAGADSAVVYEFFDAIVREAASSSEPRSALNRLLMDRLRPSAMLTKLANLLPFNVQMATAATRSTLTILGDEMAGFHALGLALDSLDAGESEVALVSGAFHAECPSALLGLAGAGELPPTGPSHTGYLPASAAAAAVVETIASARTRSRVPLALVRGTASVATEVTRRDEAVRCGLELWERVETELLDGDCRGVVVVSGASGGPARAAEAEVLAPLAARGASIVWLDGGIGHLGEAALPHNLAVGTLCLATGRLPPRVDGPARTGAACDLRRVVLACWGRAGGAGFVVLERAPHA